MRKSREEKREVQETRDFLAGMQMNNRTSDDTAANGNGNGNARFVLLHCGCANSQVTEYNVLVDPLVEGNSTNLHQKYNKLWLS